MLDEAGAVRSFLEVFASASKAAKKQGWIIRVRGSHTQSPVPRGPVRLVFLGSRSQTFPGEGE